MARKNKKKYPTFLEAADRVGKKEWGVGKLSPAPLKKLNRKIKKAVGM